MAKRNQLENPIYTEMEEKLDDIGNVYVFSKMDTSHTTITNRTQSFFHHPRTHKINLNEIKRNPSALHNTQYKKLRRREMLQGLKDQKSVIIVGM